MAIEAADSVREVSGPVEIAVLVVKLMATQAACARIPGRDAFKSINLGFIAAAVHMLFAWTVARFTAMPFRSLTSIEVALDRCDKVLGLLEIVVNFFVAGFAGV